MLPYPPNCMLPMTTPLSSGSCGRGKGISQSMPIQSISGQWLATGLLSSRIISPPHCHPPPHITCQDGDNWVTILSSLSLVVVSLTSTTTIALPSMIIISHPITWKKQWPEKVGSHQSCQSMRLWQHWLDVIFVGTTMLLSSRRVTMTITLLSLMADNPRTQQQQQYPHVSANPTPMRITLMGRSPKLSLMCRHCYHYCQESRIYGPAVTLETGPPTRRSTPSSWSLRCQCCLPAAMLLVHCPLPIHWCRPDSFPK